MGNHSEEIVTSQEKKQYGQYLNPQRSGGSRDHKACGATTRKFGSPQRLIHNSQKETNKDACNAEKVVDTAMEMIEE